MIPFSLISNGFYRAYSRIAAEAHPFAFPVVWAGPSLSLWRLPYLIGDRTVVLLSQSTLVTGQR